MKQIQLIIHLQQQFLQHSIGSAGYCEFIIDEYMRVDRYNFQITSTFSWHFYYLDAIYLSTIVLQYYVGYFLWLAYGGLISGS